MKDMFSLKNKNIWVAGHKGLVGAAMVRRLEKENCEILTMPRSLLDLTNQTETERWIMEQKPDVIIMAAAHVGGIGANAAEPADFIYKNLTIQSHIIHGAYLAGVEKLLFLGSSCIYPKMAPQPIAEESLLTGSLEPTNDAYAIAKIAGIKMCDAYRAQYGCDFISAMPCNLYGQGDYYNKDRAHVIPALLMKLHEAAKNGAAAVNLWGTGTPLREFLYVDDLADGLVHLLRDFSGAGPVNIGSGQEISIADLAALIARIVGYEGGLMFDPAKPDGTPRKVLDSRRINETGWKPHTTLEQGLKLAYHDFLNRYESENHDKPRVA